MSEFQSSPDFRQLLSGVCSDGLIQTIVFLYDNILFLIYKALASPDFSIWAGQNCIRISSIWISVFYCIHSRVLSLVHQSFQCHLFSMPKLFFLIFFTKMELNSSLGIQSTQHGISHFLATY